jgi:hypothetical protein
MWSVPRCYKQGTIIHTRVEAGSNTPIVILRVVGDEKGSLKSETVKYEYVHEPQGTQTRKRLR